MCLGKNTALRPRPRTAVKESGEASDGIGVCKEVMRWERKTTSPPPQQHVPQQPRIGQIGKKQKKPQHRDEEQLKEQHQKQELLQQEGRQKKQQWPETDMEVRKLSPH